MLSINSDFLQDLLPQSKPKKNNSKRIRPKTYADLLKKVGNQMLYQTNVYRIFLLIWLLVGVIFMNLRFLFLNKDFDCQGPGLLTDDCEGLICSLPQAQRLKYIPSENQFKSLATQFQNYFCGDEKYLDLAYASMYVGSVIGLLGLAYVSDNFGRRKALVSSLFLAVIGSVIVSVSSNITMAAMGLVLAGGGASSCITTTLCYSSELFVKQKLAKRVISYSMSYALGSILVTLLHYLIPHWQVVTIVGVVLPFSTMLLVTWVYVEQTPQFLLRNPSVDKALKALNRIGKINFKIKQIIEQQDILSVQQEQQITEQFVNQLTITPYDLFKYASIRNIALLLTVLKVIIQVLINGHVMVIDEIDSFEIYSRNILIKSIEIFVYISAYWLILRVQRRLVGLLTFGIASLSAGVLMLMELPDQKLSQGIQQVDYLLQIIIIFIFRCAVVLYNCVFYVYISELIPIRISGLAIGIFLAFGSLSTVLTPVILGGMRAQGFNAMILLCVLGFIGICLSSFLRQTRNRSVKIQIDEIRMIKEKNKEINPVRETFRRNSFSKTQFKRANKNNSLMIKSQK